MERTMRIIEIIGAAHNENIKSIAFINELTKSASHWDWRLDQHYSHMKGIIDGGNISQLYSHGRPHQSWPTFIVSLSNKANDCNIRLHSRSAIISSN